MVPGEYIDARFLLYTTLSKPWLEYSVETSYGAKMPRTSWEALADYRLPEISLAEQRRIADFLDDQVARIDNIVAAREKQAALLVEERESDIGRVFLDASSNPVVPLRRVVRKWIDYRGATPEKVESGIPLITAANVRDGRIVFDGVEEFVAENEYERWMRRGLPLVGDILLTTEAPLGQIAQIESTRVALAQRIILMRPDPETLWPRWIYWYLRSPVGRAELWSRATGSTAPGIKAERLTAVPIPVPPLLDQRRLLEPVERSESQLRDARAGLAISVRLLSELKRSLITAAVTGEFDVSTADGSRVPV